MSGVGSSHIVFTDGDNTLWDTNDLYLRAQEDLLRRIECEVGQIVPASDRIGWLRQIDQKIAQKHPRGLAYPVNLLIRRVANELCGRELRDGDNSAQMGDPLLSNGAIEEISEAYEQTRNAVPTPRPGVKEGLADLANSGVEFVVVTEREKKKTVCILHQLQLRMFVSKVFQINKRIETFTRIKRLSWASRTKWMVGDQLSKDIEPAKRAGFYTIWYPGGFSPFWEAQELQRFADHKIEEFTEIKQILGISEN